MYLKTGLIRSVIGLQKDYNTVLASLNMFKSDENRRRLHDSWHIYKSYIKRRTCAFHKLKTRTAKTLKQRNQRIFGNISPNGNIKPMMILTSVLSMNIFRILQMILILQLTMMLKSFVRET